MALGIEQAGFKHLVVVENDAHAHGTLLLNRPSWNPLLLDVKLFDGRKYRGQVDLFAGGVPCPPFSVAGEQKGADDERDLFPEAVRLVQQIDPKAVMLENVKGFLADKFASYRAEITDQLDKLGYKTAYRLINASDCGVPQLRPRCILVALKKEYAGAFTWPKSQASPPTVAEAIGDLMLEEGWPGGTAWLQKANSIAPTLVGGSKKHGGADLGPTRARQKWAELGVDGRGIANDPPGLGFSVSDKPRLTLQMCARLQGFPDDWTFAGKKTATYRQIGNALPSPVSKAVGEAIARALRVSKKPSPRPVQTSLLGRFDEMHKTV